MYGNKGTDQLYGYCAADLHLCFCICKNTHDAAQMYCMYMAILFHIILCLSYLKAQLTHFNQLFGGTMQLHEHLCVKPAFH